MWCNYKFTPQYCGPQNCGPTRIDNFFGRIWSRFPGSPAIFRVPLPKDHAQPEHKERQIGHPSQLCAEAFHLGVERLGRSICGPLNEVVQYLVLPGFDGVAGRLDLTYSAAVDGIVPAVKLFPSDVSYIISFLISLLSRDCVSIQTGSKKSRIPSGRKKLRKC